jgi:hypothetical protein
VIVLGATGKVTDVLPLLITQLVKIASAMLELYLVN